MISYLSGKIITRNEKFIILNVGGVGYKVFFSKKRVPELKDEVSFFCYTNTKKDLWEIYGFPTADELELFEFLIRLPGVGPKAALEASCIGSLEKMKKGIKNNDPKLTEELFALGQKKAQAIIFEVSRKIKVKKVSRDDEETIQALVKLGFSKTEAKEAALKLPTGIVKLEDKIKEALKTKP